ncbi:flagellar hook-basal body complex protein [Buchnera aphidicola (Nipponaphis monzeni)]|uniref:Flagellar hook-basal body complex protein FliE n=1 Tax=Buchnera aphidicola (Nipponaphis monzeni) TaxID=2495405 RepID=A0A455T9S5_9GAMM|nr:flagellar hook-basal body complex protein FliE [Buchnera aphidicola]BBI01073.1 flagellar hook-basal body complex protein [Buchnera aphidicola (Nipponaphis monzeni)]
MFIGPTTKFINHINTDNNVIQPINVNKTNTTINFPEILKNVITEVNNIQSTAANHIKKFESGDKKISLSDVMIDIQKSSIAVQMVVQIKNKIISAYREIMNMQL